MIFPEDRARYSHPCGQGLEDKFACKPSFYGLVLVSRKPNTKLPKRWRARC